MGCTPSQSTACMVVKQQNSPDSEQDTTINDCNEFEKEFVLKEIDDTVSQTEECLQDSMQSNQFDLASKSSNGSWDSGVYELEDEYSHIITEFSDPGKVQHVDKEFVPKDNLELVLEGKACPTRLSARDRDFAEQHRILEALRKEGLIVQPPSKAVGGLSFELVSEQPCVSHQSSIIHKLPPLTVRRKQRKAKVELTHEEIEQKLIQAEERRKKKTEEKLSKMVAKGRQEIQTVAQQQAEINRLKIEKKILTTTQSREKHLNEVQEKLKAREEYAKKVRERKQMLEQGFKYVLPNGSVH